MHDERIHEAEPWMAKGLRERADDLESELFPERHRALVRTHDHVELHRQKATAARLVERMLAHRASHSLTLTIRPDHVARIRHVRALPCLIRFEDVCPDNALVRSRDKGRHTIAHP